MHDATLERDAVLDVMSEAKRALQRDELALRTSACDALGIGTADWAACRDQLLEDLQEAEEWVAREEALADDVAGAPIDSDDGPEFVPSHQTVALVQSAMDEQLSRGTPDDFHRRDPRWLSVLYYRLRTRLRGKSPFIRHSRLEDFRFPLGDRATVALVSDWGTGNAHATAVAKMIAARRPDHVVHLGDVYYSGTAREVREFFLEVWTAHGPEAARYWALNANHDMYSGGEGYFGHVLPAIGQPASYFTLENRAWRLMALDSAYTNHTLNAPQLEWLRGQFGGPARNILLTHHHLLSPFRTRGDALEESLEPHLAGGRFYAWFWGHEHHLIEFADHRGVKCRCIGHGSLPYEPPDRRRPRHQADIVRWETRTSPLNPARGIHGFALLTFDGPVLHVEYVDEGGGTSWSERWD